MRGSITVVAPKVDGYVTAVLVQDFSAVKAGQVLVKLDDRIYAAKLAQARAALAVQRTNLANIEPSRKSREANVASARAQRITADAQLVNATAQLDRSTIDRRRADALVSDGSISERERDQTEGLLRQAEAAHRQASAVTEQASALEEAARQEVIAVGGNRQALESAVEASQAQVRLAEIDLENTQVKAPRDGVVGEVGVKLGQYVTPGMQLMALVPAQIWVIANFKESQTARICVGEAASMTIDAIPGVEMKGAVERLSPATGSEFSVIRTDNATGNFTKIPQRLPVRIRIDPADPRITRMRPGMSVIVAVDTRACRS
ncbi:MAG: HlyD family secretion protein [Lysobacter sp.]|nr:HlyD family secretion protein [Lysobacter sp.]